MKLILILAGMFCSASVLAKAEKNFGEAKFANQPVALSQVITNYEAYKNKEIVVKGTVSKVCEMKGCWLEVDDKTAKVRTTMKDYGFTVPKDILGKVVLIEGVMKQKDMPKSAVRHYLKDEGLSEEEIKAELDKIPGKTKKEFQFVANGVRIS